MGIPEEAMKPIARACLRAIDPLVIWIWVLAFEFGLFLALGMG